MKNCLLVTMTLIVSLLLLSGSLYAIDFEGNTVTIVSWGDGRAEFEPGGRSEGRLEEAEELFNVKVEFLGYRTPQLVDALMARLLAGESRYDIWITQDLQYWPLVSQSALLPLDGYVPQEHFDSVPALSQAVNDLLTYQGSRYTFGHWPLLRFFRVLLWNQDLFAREGLTNPFDLYQAGEWTWDALTEIAKQATKDTTGDGEIDQWGISAAAHIIPHHWAYTNGAFVTAEDEQGNMQFVFNSEATVEALEQVHQWTMIDQVIPLTPPNTPIQQFATGRFAFYQAGVWQINQILAMEDNYGILPLPRGPRVDEDIFSLHRVAANMLPVNSAYPEGLVALYEFLWPAEEYQEQLMDEITLRARDRNSAAVLMDAHDGWSGQAMHLEAAIAPVLAPAISQIVGGHQGGAAALDAVDAQVQAAINDLLGY